MTARSDVLFITDKTKLAALGQSLPKWAVRAMSVLPPIATELRTSLEVRLVPTAEVADLFNYFVGAREQRGGISMRSALVVLRLIGGRTSSVARWENRSASHPGSRT